MGKRFIIIMGILGFIIICVFCVLLNTKKIEQDLYKRATARLQKENIPADIISFSGRDALLTGNFDNLEKIKQAENSLANLYGLRIIKNKLTLSETTVSMPDLSIITNADSIIASGTLPDSLSKNSIIMALTKSFNAVNIKDKIVIDKRDK